MLFRSEIKVRYKKASESFENKNFAAIVVKYYRTRLHRLFSDAVDFLRRILESKDFIESVLLLLVAFVSIKITTLSFENISSLLSIVFASILLLTTIIKAIQRALRTIGNMKLTKKICVYGNMPYQALCKKISKVMKMRYHPVAYASLKAHIENLVYNELQDK